MGRVAGVFDNPPGFPCTPPGVDILEGGKLTSNNVAGSSHDPLQSPAVASGAVSKPSGDAAGQDALHSAGVEGVGVDRLSAWPIIGADIKHFTDYRYRPF